MMAAPTAGTKISGPIIEAKDFPVGSAGSKSLRRLLLQSQDPATDISTYQQCHSLHSMFAKGFGTTPRHEMKHSSKKTTRRSAAVSTAEEDVVEPFQPESVLTFLGHLSTRPVSGGVSRYEVHKRIADALRSELENEIARVPLPEGKDALLKLLKSSWPLTSTIPDLRPVLVSLMKKLGDQTPLQVLQLLAEKVDGRLKYAELLNQLGLPMRRLVWEADWEKSVFGDGTLAAANDLGDAVVQSNSATDVNAGTLHGSHILADLIRPAVEEYVMDKTLRSSADLPFVASIRERRIATQARRAVGNASLVASGSSALSSSTLLTNTTIVAGQQDQQQSAKSSPGLSLAKIKEVVGGRPKLLAAVLNMLIAEHGRKDRDEGPTSDECILGGATYLTCSLAADVLLSYGQLPRPYEHIGLLAGILDNCVKVGIFSDDAVAQTQGCLKIIFQQDKEQSKADGETIPGNEGFNPSSGSVTSAKVKNATPSKDDREVTLKLIGKIITAANDAMKQADPKGLFLNPVTDEIAPGYSTIIKVPMCMLSIEKKTEKLQYASLTEYERDVQVMFQNCITYNIGKEGQWFRNEAKRQTKVWKDDVLPQAQALFKTEMSKLKKKVDKARSDVEKADKKRKRDSAVALDKAAKPINPSRVGGDDDAISRLTSNDINPLPESKSEKRKKDIDFPSMPSLASMLLADPFVVRLLLDKTLRALQKDILREKSLPLSHRAFPSLLQLLHFAQCSTRLCGIKGKRFCVPDIGLIKPSAGGEDNAMFVAELPYLSLRKFTPLIAKLLLDVDLDRRMSIGGDLYDAAKEVLPPRSSGDSDEWIGASSLCVLCALVEGALVNILEPGNSNETSLALQFPRFVIAIDSLSGGNMLHEQTFFNSLVQALLRYKSKLAHSTRDLVVTTWLNWFKVPSGRSCMASPIHEFFMILLNEWASLGNLILPRDKLLSLSEDAARAAEANNNNNERDKRFAFFWLKDDTPEFARVKAQYDRMLKSVPESRRIQWMEGLGIDDASLAELSERIRRKTSSKKNKSDLKVKLLVRKQQME